MSVKLVCPFVEMSALVGLQTSEDGKAILKEVALRSDDDGVALNLEATRQKIGFQMPIDPMAMLSKIKSGQLGCYESDKISIEIREKHQLIMFLWKFQPQFDRQNGHLIFCVKLEDFIDGLDIMAYHTLSKMTARCKLAWTRR